MCRETGAKHVFVASDHDHMLGVFRARLGGEGVTFHRLGREVRDINEISSVSIRSIRKFIITEKAPTRAFSWLKTVSTLRDRGVNARLA